MKNVSKKKRGYQKKYREKNVSTWHEKTEKR